MPRIARITMLVAGAAVLGAGVALAPALGRAPAPAPSDTAAVARGVEGLRRHLAAQPRDVGAWASLALEHVEAARTTGDSSRYQLADAALREATRVAPQDARVLTARAALAAARHDFSAALGLADAALAINPYSAVATIVRTDALTELGRYAEALAAARRADDLDPSVATFARLSYAYELRGDLERARSLMRLAAASAGTRPEAAFAHTHLAGLARLLDDRAMAARELDAALRAVPTDAAALAARADLLATGGQVPQAIDAYRAVVERAPLVPYVVAFGELLESQGRAREAAEQYAVARATARLAQGNGVGVDLELALFEAEHGDAAAAVRAARAEWARRRSVHVADALGWALHRAGRDREALTYVRAATALGTRDPLLLYHRGAVEAALGRRADAIAHLRAALRGDPQFSPLHAPRARRLLAGLEATS